VRRAAVAVLICVVAVSCSGGPAESPAPWEPAADDFAVSARRALVDTRFQELGDRWLSELVMQLCLDLSRGEDPDRAVADAVAAVEAPQGSEVDDEILAEVLTVGAAQVCPEAVLDAGGVDPAAAASFLAAVRPVVGELGLGGVLDDGALLAAGLEACSALDGGLPVDAAGAAVLGSLFGLDAAGLPELEGAGLGPTEGVVAGTVLGAAAATLCGEHAEKVADYVSGVSA
jgi:hypothetical protein